MTNNELIKLIFALKVKFLRIQNKFSFQQLSNETGLSLSYLHDIEKGKKYPKVDKISILASVFGVDYDYMVSTTANKRLQPIVDLMSSDVFKIFPIEMFGLNTHKIFDLFSNAPDKLNAFIATIFKITRNYQIRTEHFYFSALRSFQDMHDNYFGELEKAVQDFKIENQFKLKLPIKTNRLESILLKNYNIKVNRSSLGSNKKLKGVRSFFALKSQTLHLNEGLESAQENFILGRELAFQYLKYKERPFESRMLDFSSFETLLNNFYASYFSVSLLMPKNEMIKDIHVLISQPQWSGEIVLNLLNKYDVTPEMLLQRMTNLLPNNFGIVDVFFIRLSGTEDLQQFKMTKELHLSRLHNAYGNVLNDHYCRRWISINIMKHFRTASKLDEVEHHIVDIQISKYWQTETEYLCISFANKGYQDDNRINSVTIGIRLSPKLRNQIKFINDSKIKRKEVHTTCERCSMTNCGARVKPPLVIENKQRKQRVLNLLQDLDN